MESLEKKFTASLHTHVRSLYDADISAQALCKRIIELGGEGCAITDHGTVTAIEEYRTVFKDNGLKLIPGCELYIEGGTLGRRHLIVLAKNDNGWKGIGKIVTSANQTLDNDTPVISINELYRIMKGYKGDVIALSACMQGVICSVFLSNSTLIGKIDKLKAKQEKYLSPSAKEVSDAEGILLAAEKAEEDATILRDKTKRLKETNLNSRKKEVEKLLNAYLPEGRVAETTLQNEIKAKEQAEKEYPEVAKKLKAAKKAVTTAKKALKEVKDSVDHYLKLESEIEDLRKELKPENELFEAAKINATSCLKIFGEGNFYIELQNHGIPEESVCFRNAAKVAKELDIPVVATNDVHILKKSEDELLKRQTLRSLRFKQWEPLNVGDEELYLKDDKELYEALVKILPKEVADEAIANIKTVFDKCNVTFEYGEHYPKFTADNNADDLLDKAVEEGIAWRFPDGMDEEHIARLKQELPVIKSMGYSDYHLIVKDFLEYGRHLSAVPDDRLKDAPLSIEGLDAFISENGWKSIGLTIGPGRGSAVGSLVCYLLGITNLDPLKYNLLFERFLNPERVSMPDIDSDLSNTIRGKVIEYVEEKYGAGAVCGIITMTKQAPKGAINSAAKYYGLREYNESMIALGRTIAKDVPAEVDTSFASIVTTEGAIDEKGEEGSMPLKDYLLDKYKDNRDAVEIIKWALVIEGSVTSYSAHAAGIVISDNKDISDYIPLRMNKELGIMTTQCAKEQVEDCGLLKFDFLGLITLDIITETMRSIADRTGKIIDPLKIDLSDKKVYEDIFQTGKTGAVFQFSSPGMKGMLKKFKPDCFEDLIILNSMYRPGPIQYIDNVCDVKTGAKEVSYLCPELEPILEKTYGAIVYQEQVMEIFQKLAGYTLGGADEVRRYMSKKKADKLAQEKEAFINGDPKRGISGCVKNGISEEIAKELFEEMSEFAKYAFNKSHAAAYSFNAYITAWLKEYYPAEFFSAALNWAKDTDEMAVLMKEAANCGIKILAPDVNRSFKNFTVEENAVRFGLSRIAGIKKQADTIVAVRQSGEFKNLKDFIQKVRPNKTVLTNLIKSGACDSFSDNRNSMLLDAAEIDEILPKKEKKEVLIKASEFLLPRIERLNSDEEVQAAQVEAGFKASITKKCTVDALLKKIENAKSAIVSFDEQIKAVSHPFEKEDKAERLNEEKALLGTYVTAHPIDLYPSAEELKCKNLGDISDDTKSVYGIVTELSIKKRKSDGAPMAFFTLEDRTGSVDVCCFTKAYANFGDKLKEGSALILTGHADYDKENEDDVKLKFYMDGMKIVEAKKTVFILGVSSKEGFTENSGAFRQNFEDENGHELYLFIKTPTPDRIGRTAFHKMPYKVSRKVLSIPNIKETTALI